MIQNKKATDIIIQKSQLLKLTKLAVQINQMAKEMVSEIIKICDENSKLKTVVKNYDENEFFQ